jgi:drug/metabolite transporter (DMT)-like permease
MHALYLGGVYISIANGLPAALSALIVGLQPSLTSTIANRLLGERVVARQWGGLLLGIAGVYLVVQDKATTGGATPLAWVASLVALLSITFGTIYQKRFGSGIAAASFRNLRDLCGRAGSTGANAAVARGDLHAGRLRAA